MGIFTYNINTEGEGVGLYMSMVVIMLQALGSAAPKVAERERKTKLLFLMSYLKTWWRTPNSQFLKKLWQIRGGILSGLPLMRDSTLQDSENGRKKGDVLTMCAYAKYIGYKSS